MTERDDIVELKPAEKLALQLRDSTEEMAGRCIVDMVLWDKHSNLALKAADRLEAMQAALDSVIASGNKAFGELKSLRTAASDMRERAAKECERLGDAIMKKAERAHRREEYDLYEQLECAATEYSVAAAAIRNLPDQAPAGGKVEQSSGGAE